MSEKRNSWARRILQKLGKRTSKSSFTKVGEKVGAPIRSALKGTVKSIKTDKQVRGMMSSGGLSGSIMGESNYNTAFNKIKNFIKDGDSGEANSFIQSQVKKIKEQQQG